MTHHIEGELIAYITDYSMSQVRPEDLQSAEALKYLSFSTSESMESMGWVKVGKATIKIEMEGEHAIVKNAVAALKAKQAEIRAKATAEVTRLEGQIHSLLAIEA